MDGSDPFDVHTGRSHPPTQSPPPYPDKPNDSGLNKVLAGASTIHPGTGQYQSSSPQLSTDASTSHSVPLDGRLSASSHDLENNNTDTASSMAAQPLQRPSLRSNGDGSTPRHPVIPNAREPRSTALRSASNPLDRRIPLHPTSTARVSDLKKRFDQNGSALSTQMRSPVTVSAATKLKQSPASSSRQGKEHHLDASGPMEEPTQEQIQDRSEYLPTGFGTASSSRSFASRIGNHSIDSSRSLAGPESAPPLQQPLQSKTPPSRGLLFGEVANDQQHNTNAPGHGIDGILEADSAHKEASESQQRPSSANPAAYSSLSAWEDGSTSQATGFTDNSSDRLDTRTRSISNTNAVMPTSIESTSKRPPTSTSSPPYTSRLPLPVKRVTNSSNSSSPTSTRSNSPPALKRNMPNNKRENAVLSPHRAKTPTRYRGYQRAGPASPDGYHRLQAPSVPSVPKSPPLRSSRPRQPVSEATTASSRMRAAEKYDARATPQAAEAAPRRRKISVGPIDFEQRREHIRLAYSRSIRESQAEEARQRAAARRKRELETAARAKLAAEANANRFTGPSTTQDDPSQLSRTRQTKADPTVSSPIDAEVPLTMATAETDTNVAIPMDAPAEVPRPLLSRMTNSEAIMVQESLHTSPDLDLPGAFPDQSPAKSSERPRSRVSAASETTEFDAEPQTTLAVEQSPSFEIPITFMDTPDLQPLQLPSNKAEYRSPFENETEPHDTAARYDSVSEMPHESRPTPNPPGAFRDFDDDDDDAAASSGHNHYFSVADVSRIQPESPSGTRDLAESQGFGHHLATSEASQTPGSQTAPDESTDSCSEDLGDSTQPGTQIYGNPSRVIQSSTALDVSSSSCASLEASGTDLDDDPTTRQLLTATGHGRLGRSTTMENRSSRQSTWTDCSVESQWKTDEMEIPHTGSPSYGHVTIFESSSPLRQSQHSLAEPQLDDVEVRPSMDSTLSAAHSLEPFPSSEEPSTLAHALNSMDALHALQHRPPIPLHTRSWAPTASTRSSGMYDQSRTSSTLLNSERPSEDHLFAGSTSSKSHLTNGDGPKLSIADNGPAAEKDRQRLVQRRNVLKELVDTEAVFVRDMNIVEEIYRGTAEACPRLDAQTVKLVFRNTEEIIEFHTQFLAALKESVASVYIPKGGKSKNDTNPAEIHVSGQPEVYDTDDRMILLGSVFEEHMEKMKHVHEGFLRNSDHAAKKLIEIQQDPAVKVWLNECNEVAKDLTAAWDLDSLLIKPMQRITKYPNLIITLLQHTPQDHPDRAHLKAAKDALETAIIEINQTKKNFELVGQIVGRKRKESDVRAGFARAFGKKVDKMQVSNRPPDDATYSKLNEKFGDDYLRLQVVLRDVEFYTRQVTAYVQEFLQYLSSIELVMRLHPGSYPELESKWVQFNISMRDLQKIALDDHLTQVRKRVIEPFEQVIKAYSNPSLAMKKRQKRRLDFERYEGLKRSGRSIDAKLKEQVEQYEALNATLLKELPQLSTLTERIGNVCLGNFVDIQTEWYGVWRDKLQLVVGTSSAVPEVKDIVDGFQREFPYVQEQLSSIGILNPAYKGRASQSTTVSDTESFLRAKPRPAELDLRGRGPSLQVDVAPSLPTPDFLKRNSGSFVMSSEEASGAPSPHSYYYRDYYAPSLPNQTSSASVNSPEMTGSSKSVLGTGPTSTRPSTGRSYDSGALPRPSTESVPQYRRDSNTTYSSQMVNEGRRFSGLFHSALPLPDGPEEHRRSSRASSQERGVSDGYNILWLAASLFEFNINTTKHEAGYPYLVYQAGEIFDVIAEKGELWLAKNQDDPREKVGWIWSKHFAKLADS